MPAKRRCESWLKTFSEWSLPRSEAPETFHFWSGVFTLASVLKRKVKIPRSYMGGYEIFPSLYTIFVAPPGKARKSTTARYSEDLLSALPTVNRAPTSMTVEQMIKKISLTPDAALSVFCSEFGMFVSKSKIDMYTALTDLFDGKKDISVETISRVEDFADTPCVNLLGATTPKWISANMPEDVIGGGFASRVVFVFEDKKRRSQLYYKEIDQDYLSGLKTMLIEDLFHIDNYIEGEYVIDEDAKMFMESWYREFDQKNLGQVNERLSGYYERKPVHIHKLAMIIHASYSDSMTLTQEDFIIAIKKLESIEHKLPKTFSAIGGNPHISTLESIVSLIEIKKRFRRSDIIAAFYQDADMRILYELLHFLEITNRIKCTVSDTDDPVYEFIK